MFDKGILGFGLRQNGASHDLHLSLAQLLRFFASNADVSMFRPPTPSLSLPSIVDAAASSGDGNDQNAFVTVWFN